MVSGISILYRKAKEEERSIFAFMDPLETEVWLYIATAYISVTVIIYLIARLLNIHLLNRITGLMFLEWHLAIGKIRILVTKIRLN